MIYSAHSPKGEIPAQPYSEHVSGVISKAGAFASAAARYAKADGELLIQTTNTAAIYHDLGKLLKENQIVLNTERTGKHSLPVNHVDAGAAYLLSADSQSVLSAVAVSSHHKGFPNFIHESNREDAAFRDKAIMDRMEDELPSLLSIHNSLIMEAPNFSSAMPRGNFSVFMRLLLSCIVDGDHTDSAMNEGNHPAEPDLPLHPKERLERLDRYVEALQSDDERGRLRTEMYFSCRDSAIDENIASCSSPVGSGKTTAVMAHLLSQAEKRGLRRIFVVLPFTNIIKQSVDTYRKALALPGENPEEVVAELHHRADFEDEDTRHLTALWRAPIVVTTAVSFFETLASRGTAGLRRLHELPGSAIFIDEAHAALPVKLLSVALNWIKALAHEWSCYWVLASGSLNRFWEIKRISRERLDVPEIVDATLRNALDMYETNRVTYKHDLAPKSPDALLEWIAGFAGPRLIIVNTVQSAAVIAERLAEKAGREHVEHLSTALLPTDREKTLKKILLRLASPHDRDWTLIATSCVEAGVNLSFRNGFREVASLTSLLQTAGRVDRSGSYKDSEVWSFCLIEDGMLKSNPQLKNAAIVLRGYLTGGQAIDPALTTDAIQKEIKLYGINSLSDQLIEREGARDFIFVDDNFRVIESDTRLAVVDEHTAKAVAAGSFSWCELQKNSLQISRYKLEDELHAPRIAQDIYHWTFGYDDFIGYMRGILN